MQSLSRKMVEAAPAERRRGERRQISLDVQTAGSNQAVHAGVLAELSPTGFLLQTSGEHLAGDQIQVWLPEAGAVSARVIWSCGQHFGCEFERPISSAVLSAIQLKAGPARPAHKLPNLVLNSGGAPAPVPDVTAGKRNSLPLVLGFSLALWIGGASAAVYATL